MHLALTNHLIHASTSKAWTIISCWRRPTIAVGKAIKPTHSGSGQTPYVHSSTSPGKIHQNPLHHSSRKAIKTPIHPRSGSSLLHPLHLGGTPKTPTSRLHQGKIRLKPCSHHYWVVRTRHRLTPLEDTAASHHILAAHQRCVQWYLVR